MDLFAIAGDLTSIVNPMIDAVLEMAVDPIIADDGRVLPQVERVAIQIEVQAASSNDLKQLNNVNIQSDYRVVYTKGGIKALNRPLQLGGDLFEFYGSKWLVVCALEEWGDGEWSKLLVARQIAGS